MKSDSATLDKAAIGLSLFCAVHCLMLPVALALLPAIATTSLGSEAFHQWMLIAVLPTSVIALHMGCKQHRDFSVLYYGVPGLILITATVFWGHDLLGETDERISTLIGAGLIAYGHLRNHRLCCKHECH